MARMLITPGSGSFCRSMSREVIEAMKIFHVSDLHFGANPSSNRDAITLLGHVWTGFDSAVDHLMITGDITANGDEGEYFQAARALSRFQGRLLLVPGNHDYCNWGNDFGEERARRFESHLLAPLAIQHSFLQKDPFVNVLTDGGVRVLTVGLSSNRTNPRNQRLRARRAHRASAQEAPGPSRPRRTRTAGGWSICTISPRSAAIRWTSWRTRSGCSRSRTTVFTCWPSVTRAGAPSPIIGRTPATTR